MLLKFFGHVIFYHELLVDLIKKTNQGYKSNQKNKNKSPKGWIDKDTTQTQRRTITNLTKTLVTKANDQL